jgi:hypothetical protein
MQSVTEAPITIYRHYTNPVLPTDEISPLGSGNIFTDIIVASSPQTRPRVIKCVKHPLNGRDAGFLSVNWEKQRLETLRRVLVEVQECGTAYWAQQPADHQRFGRREALAREHSIKIIEMAIVYADQDEREKREGRTRRTSVCVVM